MKHVLDWLAWDIYKFETSCTNSFSSSPYIPKYALLVCEICNCSGHDSNSCPCDIFADGFARLSNTIEIMNEQQVKLTNFMREHDHRVRLTLGFVPMNLMSTCVMIVSIFLL